MKQFMDKDFLLSTPTAQHLFHDYADQMPIVDYHCHINPKEIAEDRKFENITQVWLGGELLLFGPPEHVRPVGQGCYHCRGRHSAPGCRGRRPGQ